MSSITQIHTTISSRPFMIDGALQTSVKEIITIPLKQPLQIYGKDYSYITSLWHMIRLLIGFSS